ncbi:hypothetical protein [Paenibacillus tyrfis]|uniref:Uncharacterized protein n=1 Tax=Paenibacillus tyrfis TaxID=1501230 RepID=A0A081P429_9BACL|nr:hypothetical protein [Paenibacillus tyrfis]KEQ25452.1 hypothetical protein ET33_01645 [Paenibacillus tyrfis]
MNTKIYIKILILIVVVISFSSGFTQSALADTYFYDSNGKLTQQIRSDGSVSYYYDQNGNLLNKLVNNNIMANYSFETYSGTNGVADNWNAYADPGINPVYQVVTWPVSAGQRAQKLAASNIPSGGLHIFQDTMVKSDTTYSLSGRLRISELMNAKASVFVYFYDAAYNLLGSENIAEYTANMDYTSLVGSFTTPAGTTQARVHIRLDALAKGGGGTLHADSFAIKKESAANLLINGGYEDNTGTKRRSGQLESIC